jgi:hypothetical protein
VSSSGPIAAAAPASTERPPAASIARAVWLPLATALPVRLALAAGTELSPDEAYYLCAARLGGSRPRLVDHPPLVPWVVGLADRLPGLPLELRVRAPFVALSVALSVACVGLARRAGAGPRGLSLVAWATSWGLLPMAGGFVATPDLPALLAVAALLAWAEPTSTTAPGDGPRRDAGPTLAVGLAVALGALAKVVVLPIALVVALAARRRSTAARAGVLAPTAAVLALALPSLRFQTAHAFGRVEGWSLAAALGAVGAALGAQVLLWSPWLLGRGGRRLARRWDRPDGALVATMTALVVASALVRAVPPEPNWWAPAAIAVAIAAGAATPERREHAADLADRAAPAILAWLVGPTLIAAVHALHPFLPLPPRADPTARLHGWATDHPPLTAAGVGPYAEAAERCARTRHCTDMENHFNRLSEPH